MSPPDGGTRRLLLAPLRRERGGHELWLFFRSPQGSSTVPERLFDPNWRIEPVVQETFWMHRVDEEGETALVRTPEPVNKSPDFVRYMVRKLQLLSPMMGKKRIAQILARAGLHLAVNTVGRIVKEKDAKPPEPTVASSRKTQPVKAEYPNHAWQTDLTVVPTFWGFWAAWFPFSAPQTWPFCWWVACVVDHYYSRRVMGFTVFRKEPKSRDMCAFLGRVVGKAKATPKYLLSDKGRQFWCRRYKAWCKRRGIRPRYASTGGQVRATALVERFIKSLKDEWLGRIAVPLRREAMRREVALYLSWYDEFRPHQGLGGRTPKEVYEKKRPANRRPRHEPRPGWPADSPCALPRARTKSAAGARFVLKVRFHGGSRYLPIVELRRVA